ncbi:hypothetical protein [Nostoc sphaeroides]|uniref:Class I SAM-dependent methyltransferase n=1 Tax=Nostoc sphaeroides CCNUC1 TaxID=2653204 RepID=A0A5P8VZT2_9NOSO|nr:hypothetical protein [Nostoc sphaeroides]QFS45942.1 class I SAM-dependent methyltransferase [Nostoc sphaeroides CCNUC1]
MIFATLAKGATQEWKTDSTNPGHTITNLGHSYIEALKQFAIRNTSTSLGTSSQFAITFCDGDLYPDTFTRCLIEALDLNPQSSLNRHNRLKSRIAHFPAVVWNNRDQEDALTTEYSRIVREASNNHPAESRMQSVEPLLVTPHFVNIREYNFTYRQQLDLTGLIGRAMSVSYLPREGSAYEQLIDNFQELYQRFRDESGFVYMVYHTSVHLGEVI